MKILLIEDNAPMRHTLTIALAERYTIIEAATDEEAQRRLLDKPDVILMDWNLGGEFDGTALLAEAVKIAPVIITTGYTEAAIRIQAIAFGACAFLTKPYELDDLVAAIEAARVPAARTA